MSNLTMRRQFHGQVASLLGGGAWLVAVGCSAQLNEPGPVGSGGACNFIASFMTWDFPPQPQQTKHDIPYGNLARIQLDSIVDVVNEESGQSNRFVLIAPCRTERVYAVNNLFQIPSTEYRNIYSLAEERGVERSIVYSGDSSQAVPIKGLFRSLKIDVIMFPKTRVLSTPAEINEATAANLPLVGRTELRDPARKERYILAYPIKTINFQPRDNSFQIDTGPLIVPDFKSEATRPIDRLEMAHVAYNHKHPERAEFILRKPTPITDASGRELCRVLHYSEVREHEAQNRLLAGLL